MVEQYGIQQNIFGELEALQWLKIELDKNVELDSDDEAYLVKELRSGGHFLDLEE